MKSLALVAALSLSACLHARQPEAPALVIKPGPLACIGAQGAKFAELEAHRYLQSLIDAQLAYVCSGEPVPAPPPTFSPPTLQPAPQPAAIAKE
jgi:hypothetical protein